jgi:hypothetical protein
MADSKISALTYAAGMGVGFIATKYRFDITQEQAYQLLKA